MQQQKGFVLFLTLMLLTLISLVLLSEYQQFWLLEKGLKQRRINQHNHQVLSQCLDAYIKHEIKNPIKCQFKISKINPYIHQIHISYEESALTTIIILNNEPTGLKAGLYAKRFYQPS